MGIVTSYPATKWNAFWWIVGILIFASFVGFIVWGRYETHKHTMTCNPMTTNIIGMDMDTVSKVCGEPWSAEYRGYEPYTIDTTWHYSGGNIYFRGYGANNAEAIVTGWKI